MFSRTKRIEPVKKWHSKAMMVDPRKTKLTIINGERPDLAKIAFEKRTVAASTELTVDTLFSCDSSGNSEMAAEISGTSVSFVLVEEYAEP